MAVAQTTGLTATVTRPAGLAFFTLGVTINGVEQHDVTWGGFSWP